MSHDPETAIRDPARLAALDATGLLDTSLDGVFDHLARLAVLSLRADAAAVSLVGADREFALTCVRAPDLNATQAESSLSRSFCKHAVATRRPLVIADTQLHPWVAGTEPTLEGVRSYAGFPLVTRSGHALGALCVYGYQPRRWTNEELAVLGELAQSVQIEIELRKILRAREKVHQAQLQGERMQALDELAVGLRHEINNALTGLLLHSESLREAAGLTVEERRSAQMVHDQAWRIAETVQRLDDIESLESTSCPLGRPMIDLSRPSPRSSDSGTG